MDDTAQAVTPHAHDLTPVVDLTGQHGSGPFRTRLPHYVDLLPPCNHACPAGENIQAWLALAQAGDYRRAWETLMADNPLPATHGRVCYHPCEIGLQPRRTRRRGVDPRGRTLPRRHGDRGRLDDPGRARHRQAHPGRRRRSERSVGRLSPGPARPPGRDPRGRPGARRHAAFRHPGLSPAARRPARRDRPHRAAWACSIVLNHKVTDVLAERDTGRFDAVFVAIGAHVGKHVDIPARDAVRVLDAVALLRETGTGEQAAARPPGRGLRRRQHRDGCRAQPSAASAPRRR